MGKRIVTFIYHHDLGRFDYGPEHPLRIERLDLTVEAMRSCGLFNQPNFNWLEARPVSEKRLLTFHRPEYLQMLKKANEGLELGDASAFGLGSNDNPVFPGLLDWSRLVSGASVAAAEEVARRINDAVPPISFAIPGGMHHATPVKATGFCYINDVVLAINALLDKGLKVAYVDIDAHHGDWVQRPYFESDRVLTISIHQMGRNHFPGTGRVAETGIGRGRGYSVNLPLLAYTDDQVWRESFDEVVPPLLEAFKPDVLVTQLGVDILHSDPLTGLYCTEKSFSHAVTFFKSTGLPWVALGGGGYHVPNVVRCWTIGLALMLGLEPPREIPAHLIDRLARYGRRRLRFEDDEMEVAGPAGQRARSKARLSVEKIKLTIFPAHGIK